MRGKKVRLTPFVPHNADLFAGIGQQGNVPRSFNGYSNSALVFGTHTGFAARENAAVVIDKAAQIVQIFPVDLFFLIGAIQANLPARLETPPGATGTARATPAEGTTTRAAVFVPVSIAAGARSASAARPGPKAAALTTLSSRPVLPAWSGLTALATWPVLPGGGGWFGSGAFRVIASNFLF
jgi:hypothetical protein